ncbi:hypothetical protein [Niastella populi]|uniref:Lipoprotein n=1 Tax=Niastella populi TaxID=550983 RepID=A0A1V9FYA7_9BACT|nr:hypothetical protein [Niastella populi]OQP63345.1 hypothetical protein A4R26_33825 [Niastella populi]
MKRFIVFACIGVAAFITGCKKSSFDNANKQEYNGERANSDNAKGPNAFPDKTVRVLYLLPKDVSLNNLYFKSILKAAPVLQEWYKDQLDGKTYKLNKPVVEICKSQKPEAWFRAYNGADVSGTDPTYYFWFNTITEVRALLKKSWDLTKYTFTIYIDADGTGTGCKFLPC